MVGKEKSVGREGRERKSLVYTLESRCLRFHSNRLVEIAGDRRVSGISDGDKAKSRSFGSICQCFGAVMGASIG